MRTTMPAGRKSSKTASDESARKKAEAFIVKARARRARDMNGNLHSIIFNPGANYKLKVGDLKHLRAFPKLRYLDLSGCPVTDKWLLQLKRLNNLQTLKVNGCPRITNAGLRHLEELKKLREVHVKGTRVTESGVQKLQESLPKCNVVR